MAWRRELRPTLLYRLASNVGLACLYALKLTLTKILPRSPPGASRRRRPAQPKAKAQKAKDKAAKKEASGESKKKKDKKDLEEKEADAMTTA